MSLNSPPTPPSTPPTTIFLTVSVASQSTCQAFPDFCFLDDLLENVRSLEHSLFSIHYYEVINYHENSALNVIINMPLFLSRPLAYSTLADLVHHVRQNLPLTDLSLAVQLFAKNIDDESLPSNIQTMSCKLLLNLVDCIRSKSEQENGNGRDILMRMLEVGSTELASVEKTLMYISHTH